MSVSPTSKLSPAYQTPFGAMYHGKSEEVLASPSLKKLFGQVQLVFTSPPFPLNRKKKYGNMTGETYVKWVASLAPLLTKLLTPTGSIVIELGNAWEEGTPTMSTLSLEALLAFKKAANLHLCQEFICFNPARLPTPAQWVTIDRVRVKDAFTRLWWMSPTPTPKADNRRVLREYSDSMKKLLKNKTYNAGKRKSEHSIGETSFLKNNKGAIPPNVFFDANAIFDFLVMANTQSTGVNGKYQKHCEDNELTAHPARMQMELAEFFIKFLTDEGDTVLDPFGGSNTSGYAAEMLKRKWVAIEASHEYILGSHGRFFPGTPVRKVS